MQEELRQLRNWNITLMVMFVMGAAVGGANYLLHRAQENAWKLDCEKTNEGGLVLHGMDGPYVVTHIVAMPSRSVATLPEPLGWIESGSYEIPLATLKKLKWSAGGRMSTTFPENSTSWRVLYLNPQYSPEKETTP